MEQCERLRKYNRWRRGDNRLKMPDPKKLGELLDSAADRLEVLEREHAEFFERWHDERRKRENLVHDVERCCRMLQSEPDTTRALLKAESILWGALADQRVGGGRAMAPSIDAAYAMGAKGGPTVEAERLAFEAWMRGHCWAIEAEWDGAAYLGSAERGGYVCRHAIRIRQLWAAWRDRAALASNAGVTGA